MVRKSAVPLEVCIRPGSAPRRPRIRGSGSQLLFDGELMDDEGLYSSEPSSQKLKKHKPKLKEKRDSKKEPQSMEKIH